MPDTSVDEFARLARDEKDAKTCRKYMAAYHRKKGLSFKEIGALVFATHIAVRNWLMAMHKGGLGAAPPRKIPGRPRKIPLDIRRKLLVDIRRGRGRPAPRPTCGRTGVSTGTSGKSTAWTWRTRRPQRP